MLRLVLFSLIPFFIAAFVIYFVLAIVKGIMRTFRGPSRPSSRFAQSAVPPKPKESYRDVQEAKFVELPNEDKENNSE
jgi:hypothetical protein